MSTDKRVDAYITKAAEFAQPILRQIRETVHEAVPEVEETMKWGMPFFEYQGILCGMSAFKAHCALVLWKSKHILPEGGKSAGAMGAFGRLKSVKDLPAKKVLVGYLKKAKQLNEEGVGSPIAERSKRQKKDLIVPPYFQTALKKDKKAKTTFDGFSYAKQKDYVEWVGEAKTEETRRKRLATSMQWLAEGKSRNWKYERG
ncbi:MAG: YdeI/OmpD-associated family protein [Terriglobia bacterium]|jgi:uncharacterized protein YdeI (YjbR/CyaY-like superfamily)|nr:YdeI/OmpD-associated family protein [Terriglobia bacterium]